MMTASVPMSDALQPRLTVLIISWNGWRLLEPCLRAVFASDFEEFEILVIDNGSQDGTVAKLEQLFPKVRIIANQDNIGHTRGANLGFRAANGQEILLLDHDTELAPDAIGILMRFLDLHPDVDVIAPRTYNSDGTVQESARNFPSPMAGIFGRQSLFARVFPGNPFSKRYLKRDFLAAVEPFQVDSVASSCMLIRKSVIDRFGVWDESFPGYFVETDWCFSLKQGGAKIFCVPAAGVVHHEGNSHARKRSPRRIVMFHLGALHFYKKNHTSGWLDPRSWIAATALGLRMVLLLVVNAFKSDDQPPRGRRAQVRESHDSPGAR